MADGEGELQLSSCEKSRKRARNDDKWKRKCAKICRNLGQEYISDKTNKLVPAKRQGVGCNCNARAEVANVKWCKYHVLTQNERDDIFREFYAIGDYNAQNAFLFGLISQNECSDIYVKKRVNKNTSRRHVSFIYHVKNCNGRQIRVCSKGFCDVFGISKRRLSTARGDRKNVSESLNDGKDSEHEESPPISSKLSPHVDRRGKHGNYKHKISEEDKKSVIEHIKKFPLYVSHYCRKKSQKKYIRAVKSVAEMYRLYEDERKAVNKNCVSYDIYRTIFNTRFNIGFKMPYTDTCKVCDAWLAKEEDIIPLDIRLHQTQATAAYSLLSKFRSECLEENCDYCLITYDLQKALPTPKIPTGIVFYLRQLWVYNLGIHVCNKKTAFMCMWPENIASRGASEIASCLFKVLRVPENVLNKRKLRFFSDSCSAQNKNNILYYMYYALVMMGMFDCIEHYYLVPGHTFLPSDRDFGTIEKRIRKTDYVFTPNDWFRLVETSRVKNPFQVLRMKTEDFKNFHSVSSLIARNPKNVSGQKMPVRKIAVLRIEATKPGILQYKTNYSDVCPWEEVQVFNKTAGRPRKDKNLAVPSQEMLQRIFHPSNMQCLYPAGRKISAAKHKDLMSLLPYIPQNHHDVYFALQPDNLSAAEEVEEDPDN